MQRKVNTLSVQPLGCYDTLKREHRPYPLKVRISILSVKCRCVNNPGWPASLDYSGLVQSSTICLPAFSFPEK